MNFDKSESRGVRGKAAKEATRYVNISRHQHVCDVVADL